MAANDVEIEEVMSVRRDFMEADRRLHESLRQFLHGKIGRSECLTALIDHQLSYNNYIGKLIWGLGLKQLNEQPD